MQTRVWVSRLIGSAEKIVIMSFLHKLNTNIYEKQAHKIYPQTDIKEKKSKP